MIGLLCEVASPLFFRVYIPVTWQAIGYLKIKAVRKETNEAAEAIRECIKTQVWMLKYSPSEGLMACKLLSHRIAASFISDVDLPSFEKGYIFLLDKLQGS
ncbi:hypothetical protein DB41_HH00310 [Neochlamydia sp. TUME1]|uniref:hypothetical protein n=1 Tax=Neochlamydia sp. TUME1 TaxID=1478174 RepID=UPI00057C8258|nr:hypothetical protein [Neochlamydia sp. TUME1]KIC75738.1 hypothetical protein DB41_HH00310 [Neochlamydia sp. TUME1]